MTSLAFPHRPRPVVLCILDGWGWREAAPDNAITLAKTPNWDRFLASYPHALLQSSGLQVGLPDGQMGNSEVGHMNLGAGRVVMQELPRIDTALADGSLAANPKLVGMIRKLGGGGLIQLPASLEEFDTPISAYANACQRSRCQNCLTLDHILRKVELHWRHAGRKLHECSLLLNNQLL